MSKRISEQYWTERDRAAMVEDACFDRSEVSPAVNLGDLNAEYSDVVPGGHALGKARISFGSVSQVR
jgi:hypothetical protein